MAERVEHWFNRRYGTARRDVCLLRTETGWQVLGRQGGADGPEVTHYFDREDEAAPGRDVHPGVVSGCRRRTRGCRAG